MTYLLDCIQTTSEVAASTDSFERIIGQPDAVRLVRSAVQQRRHVLLCGVPGTGKSMIAKAAYSLLPPPKEEVLLNHNPSNPDRPLVVVTRAEADSAIVERPTAEVNVRYSRPEELPFEIAVKMGYRCPKCGSLSLPDQGLCMDCGSAKRCDWSEDDAYHGLFRMFDVVKERALVEVIGAEKTADGLSHPVTYRRETRGSIRIERQAPDATPAQSESTNGHQQRVLLDRSKPRFVKVAGASPVELLGDVKHDPYGSAESLGTPAYMRVVPGAIHEAHEGILYVDELAALGPYQKHLLTAMQDRRYSISGHNPQSSGAAVRVDDVPCDFILFASCNVEDLPLILPPLRSRIRGYGYEIMLSSCFDKTPENIDAMVRFMADTVVDDGRIPHLSVEAVEEVLKVAEEMAYSLDGQKSSLTLRLRELGGIIRTSGDLAVQEGSDLTGPVHVRHARHICFELGPMNKPRQGMEQSAEPKAGCGSYFF